MLTIDGLKRDRDLLGLQVLRNQPAQDGKPASSLSGEDGSQDLDLASWLAARRALCRGQHVSHGFVVGVEFDWTIGNRWHRGRLVLVGTMVAESEKEIEEMIIKGMTQPLALKQSQDKFIHDMFNGTADGYAGKRIAE